MLFALRSPLLARHSVRHGFSLRTGGVSRAPFDSLNLGRSVGDDPEHVAENHAILARDIGYDAGRLYEVNQVHGAMVERVDGALAPELLRAREADGLVCSAAGSGAAGLALGVRVADCVAVLFAHPASGAVAAAHAGWRGVVQGVLARTVAALGAEPTELLAAIFPHIGVDAFEVGPDVAEQIAQSVPSEPNVIVRGRAEFGSRAEPRASAPHADLGLAVTAQLRACGLRPEHVDRVAGCTFSEPERFFSYRRDGARSGRHLAVIVPGC